MKKTKHSKFKNTGMLFELLVRQVTSDIISGSESQATTILKKYFNKNSELFKEYSLYKTLSDERFSSDQKCNMLIEAVLKAHKQLDKSKLKNEKYNLIKTISENFFLDSFFQTQVQNYKLLASIYKIFEYVEHQNPRDIIRSKITIIENMMKQKKDVISEYKTNDVSSEPKEIRLMSYKILVDKFNAKYDDLLPEQKNILREYISNISSTNNLKYFVQAQAESIKETLSKKYKLIKDKTLKIKIKEVINLLEQYNSINRVDDHHIVAILRYNDLIKDLNEVY